MRSVCSVFLIYFFNVFSLLFYIFLLRKVTIWLMDILVLTMAKLGLMMGVGQLLTGLLVGLLAVVRQALFA